MRQVLKPITLIILLGNFGLLWAQQAAPAEGKCRATHRVNQRDRNKTEPTADQQKDKSDRELAREVRRALMRDKSLSCYAQNVKVIAQNGVITLKGSVRFDVEKQTVETKAAE